MGAEPKAGYVYDNNGNLTYYYDAFNRLAEVYRVSNGEMLGSYVYDALNRRAMKTIYNGGATGNIPDGDTNYFYWSWQVIEEQGDYYSYPNTLLRQYVWGQVVPKRGPKNPGVNCTCKEIKHACDQHSLNTDQGVLHRSF